MKRFTGIFLAVFIISSLKSFSQVSDRNSVFKCAEIFGDSITFLNDFEVVKAKRKAIEDPNGEVWEIYLMRGTVYRFALCNNSKPKSIVLKLYNDTVTEKHPFCDISPNSPNNYFDFICKQSDVYKVSIRFKNKMLLNQELSAIGILGFIRKIKL